MSDGKPRIRLLTLDEALGSLQLLAVYEQQRRMAQQALATDALFGCGPRPPRGAYHLRLARRRRLLRSANHLRQAGR